MAGITPYRVFPLVEGQAFRYNRNHAEHTVHVDAVKIWLDTEGGVETYVEYRIDATPSPLCPAQNYSHAQTVEKFAAALAGVGALPVE